MNSIVAPNVKRIIREKGLKQNMIARKTGYSDHQFSSMMNGRKIMKDTDILNIATALCVDVNELFKEAGE